MRHIAVLAISALPLFASIESVRVHHGDDLRWAEPSFDDTQWSSQDSHGEGWRWARYKVRIPDRVLNTVIGVGSTTMEVYVEGRLIGRHGRLPPAFEDSARGYSTFPLPADLEVPGRVVTVALRTWSPPGSRFRPVPLNPPQVFVHPAGETSIYATRSLAAFRGYLWSAILALGLLVFVVIAGRTQQQGREFGFAVATWSGFAAYELILAVAHLLPWSRGSWLTACLFGTLLIVLCLEFTTIIAGSDPPVWMRAGQWFLVFAHLLLFAANIHYEPPVWTTLAGYCFMAAGFVPPALGAAMTWRSRQTRIRGLLMLLTFALAVNAYTRVAGARGCSTDLNISGVDVPANTLGFTAFGLLLAGVMLARFRRAGETACALQGQLAAARRVQEMLLMGRLPTCPAYTIDTAYRPAREVGGDFFRILPASRNATLAVVGDVSGKGVEAAMLVSVIVGALLNRHSDEPAALLEELNTALAGQMNGGFVTCCAARFETDGRVTVASAGHPAPYCGGVELDVSPGLPLGVSTHVKYAESTYQLKPAEQLTLLSDGVIEAANPAGELFGFGRTEQVSERPASEIADAAAAWGQNDDITVVTFRASEPCNTSSDDQVSQVVACLA